MHEPPYSRLIARWRFSDEYHVRWARVGGAMAQLSGRRIHVEDRAPGRAQACAWCGGKVGQSLRRKRGMVHGACRNSQFVASKEGTVRDLACGHSTTGSPSAIL